MPETGRNLEINQLKVPMPLLERVGRLAVLGRYPFLFEETAEGSFDDLTERICAAVRPLNVIEEMFVADVVALQWEIAELRRVKAALIAVTVYEALKKALDPLVSYDLLADEFKQRLTEGLQENASEDENEEFVQNLVRKYIDNEEDAETRINEILLRGGKNHYVLYCSVKKDKVEALA